MEKKIPMTQQGYNKLEEELRHLKNVERPTVIKAIADAREHGDLSENAEYHEAKDALGFVEGHILEIEDLLKNAVVVEQEANATNVRVGTTATVSVNGKEKSFMIVGSNEADPLAGKISNESPIGRALLGSKVGDQVEVETPAGTTVYEVLRIS